MAKIIVFITTFVTMNTLFLLPVFAQTSPSAPVISSQSAVMIDADNGSILYEKNSTIPMYPASLTKIATAIYAIENGDLDNKVTVSENAVDIEGTTVFLEAGEQLTLRKLIQGLLINSGNDAGIAIAEHLSGSVNQFAEDLNNYLKNKIGVEQTHFENPHGLFHPDHTTTAKDLAMITKYALKNREFRDIFGTVEMEWHGKSWDTTLISHHKMLKGEIPFAGVAGGKTGYVDQSGHTLATLAKREHLNLIVITMQSPYKREAYQDTASLLNYGFDHFETTTIKGLSKKDLSKVDFNNKEFIIPENLTYTHLKNQDKVTKKMTKEGKLELYNQNGERINSYQLVEAGSDQEDKKTEPVKKEETSKSGIYVTSLMAGVIIAGFIGFVYRKKRIQKNSYRSFM
ncbi:D-alanyl-D-alanine carboxypeptidase [Virgibacillus sp. MSP4-1]|uniref:D-alanyl-D-alanine carboxypeptidase family protein n=1 Tax=Virgibacillus sp. MSP4-1 TaxID=2700081 RepID=UPI0003A49D85|nr:D-alanyl-D-alanine carboxypeptidase family protein [Virgibacillus sp. MSP4-1]QHS21565.1 D-alanyl-D-alanine carboxypeptidase [Virgibacillus sp. MSP4-1]